MFMRKRFPSFGMKSTFSNLIRSSLVSTVGYLASNSIKMSQTKSKYQEQFDLAVIGGGSGGLATAFQAAKYGLKVIVIDYVQQSPQKTKWGLGGTCVNVGCIPKKLFHQSAKYGQQIINANDYGWVLPNQINDRQKMSQVEKYFQWQKLKGKVQSYIKSMNFGYISKINQENIQYLNCLATFKDTNTVICSKNPQIVREFVRSGNLPESSANLNNNNQVAKTSLSNAPLYYEIKAKNFLIATGTRPSYLNVQGHQYGISSDDVFSLKKAPGKTLIIGGGYVAVQIAGFLRGFGYDTTLMTRGQYLRSFDRDMVKYIIQDLQQRKVNIVQTSLPQSIKKNQTTKKLQVVIQNQVTKQVTQKQQFDTVLFAVGRYATTDLLNLDKIGLNRSKKTKKILSLSSQKQLQQTNIPNIYAIGDVVQNLPQLTSTAVKMGQHLGRRIANKLKGNQGDNTLSRKFKQHEMSISLENYPTTIFTPLEYSCAGLNEEEAIKKFGRDNIQVYHIKYKPLEESILEKYTDDGKDYKVKVYAKAVVDKEMDRVLGLHYAGPHAGQIMQGFAVAIKMGLAKSVLDSTIGIHPTIAQDLTNMVVTKSSGQEFQKTSC